MQVLDTKTKALSYAAKIQEITGEKQLIFPLPEGSSAYMLGFRFGSCAESQRASYESEGAVFCD